MHDWDPALYQRFESERTRPAVELLARVSHPAPRHIVDLGCGNGNSTQLLLERFPQSQLIGLDNSEAMLASARKRLPGVPFVQADIADWAPTVAPDLIFANASLQWVAGHAGLFARLMRCLAPGGVLAVQMPDNLDQPSHQLMRELASQSAWRDQLAHAADQRAALLSVEAYYDLLAPMACRVDIWHTAYRHVMPSVQAIVEWLESTGLKPFLDPLPAVLRDAYLQAYTQRIGEAYTKRADGHRLFAFPRLFIVAQRAP